MPRVEIPQFDFKVRPWNSQERLQLHLFFTCIFNFLSVSLLKVVMLGDISTGKTSLVYRFTQGYYRDDGHPPTTEAFFSVKKVQTVGGMTCNVQIWDTAGVPERKKFAHLYYKNADAAIICCDSRNPQSYEVLRIWLEELRKQMSGRFDSESLIFNSIIFNQDPIMFPFEKKNQ